MAIFIVDMFGKNFDDVDLSLLGYKGVVTSLLPLFLVGFHFGEFRRIFGLDKFHLEWILSSLYIVLNFHGRDKETGATKIFL